jgi:putative phosphoesterase
MAAVTTSTWMVGVISDTHGLLRPQAVQALQGSDLIVHAGDVGRESILAELRELAPVTAVRGNVDRGAWAEGLPTTQALEVGGTWLYVLHDLHTLDLDPVAAGFRVVIYGHSHQPEQVERSGVLYLNPGSAGPRRFRLPVCLARLLISPDGVRIEPVDLNPT